MRPAMPRRSRDFPQNEFVASALLKRRLDAVAAALFVLDREFAMFVDVQAATKAFGFEQKEREVFWKSIGGQFEQLAHLLPGASHEAER
jgi:hypothetical protein